MGSNRRNKQHKEGGKKIKKANKEYKKKELINSFCYNLDYSL